MLIKYKIRKIEEIAVKCCLLDMICHQYAWTHSICGYLHKACHRESQLKTPQGEKKLYQGFTFNRKANSSWRIAESGESQFSLGSDHW